LGERGPGGRYCGTAAAETVNDVAPFLAGRDGEAIRVPADVPVVVARTWLVVHFAPPMKPRVPS